MGRIKQAIMWLEENGYEASDENLKFVPIEPEIKASPDTIKTYEADFTAYVNYKSKAHD